MDEPTVNEAAFTALPSGIMLMQANFADHAFERHSHDCYAIGATTHGVQRFRCKGKRYDSQAGDLVLFNPNEDHDGQPGTADGFRYTIWYVPEDFVASCLANGAASPGRRYFARPHVADRQMAQAFGVLSTSLDQVAGESLRAESMARSFLGALLSRHAEQTPAESPLGKARSANLARVKDYLRAHYQRDITVSELAAVAGLSRAHLTRAFNAAFHCPPHVYLNALRIARAQALIGRGMPLSTVALECGFADQSHLARRFKGSTGVTPSAWRHRTYAR